ncbi:MAG: 3-phosphoshikimate 1-carboxyvinyltransferase, partial [Candidatus Magasanikiibacteriota bacterium]
MKLVVSKIDKVSGQVTPPASKSQTIRALFFACLAQGSSILINPLVSDDTETAIKVCEDLGVKIFQVDNSLVIQSQGIPLVFDQTKINTGNSGIATRFLLPILGLRKDFDNPIIVDCGEQMKQRPLNSLLEALTNLGLKIECLENTGTCPVKISGKLMGGKAEVNGLTSQFISALLISLPLAQIDSEITVHDLHERPYLDMTLAWLKELGIKIDHIREDKKDIFKIPCGQYYRSFTKQILADFSSLSYPLSVAVLIPGEVRLQGIDMDDCQGDKRLIEILQAMGADIMINNSELLIKGGQPLQGITIDANGIPDMVPTLAVVATQAMG